MVVNMLCLFRCCLFLLLRRPPGPTLFPYTTLFRSGSRGEDAGDEPGRPVHEPAPERRDRRDARHGEDERDCPERRGEDRKSTRLNSSHVSISYAVFCLKKKNRS